MDLKKQAVELKAGTLTMWLDPDTAFLRYVRLGDHEVVRGIYGAVLDGHGAVFPRQVSDLTVEQEKESFTLSCRVRCPAAQCSWRVEIRGDAEGAVVYRLVEEERGERFRGGLFVLHPMAECAGKPCQVEHRDGQVDDKAFSGTIAPELLFKDVSALRYTVGPGQRVEVRFEGFSCETEDRRNWTEATFLTSGGARSSERPDEAGADVDQTVRIMLLEPRRRILPINLGRGAQLSIATTPVLARPPVGVRLGEDMPSVAQITRLKALQLGHVRVDLRLGEGDTGARLEEATWLAGELGVALHLALTLSEADELEVLAAEIERVRPPVSLWMVFQDDQRVPEARWINSVRGQLPASSVLFAAGTNGAFADLNRNRPEPTCSALPCYSINPQDRLSDNASLVETLAAQPVTVDSARQFCPRQVVISCSLRPQQPWRKAEPGQLSGLPPGVDPRQMSLFGASWTLGSLARLSLTGHVHSLTYYEAVGWRGLMEREAGSRAPNHFPSQPGFVFPLYHVLGDLAGYQRVYPTHSTHPLQVEGLTLVDQRNRRRILVANLLGENQQIKIKSGTAKGRVRILDGTTVEQAMRDPESFQAALGEQLESAGGKLELNLAGYATARVDLEG